MRIALGTLALLVTVASCSDSTSPPGLPAELQLVSGATAITAHVGDTLAPIVVQMRDANGRAVSDVPVVAWGTVGPVPVGRTDYGVTGLDSVVFTDQSGRASIRMVAPTVAGTGTITVQIGNVPTDQSSTHAMGTTIPITTTAGPFAQLAVHRMQRFAGATFSIDSLFTAADRYGNPVSGPSPQVTVTNGWHVSGNTLTPPSGTYTGTTLASAVANGVSASDSVSVVEDLRAYHWSEQGVCVSSAAAIAAGAPDSTVYGATNGVAHYMGDNGYAYLPDKTGTTVQPVVEFYFTGNYTTYKGGSATTTGIMDAEPYGIDAFVQRPDTLVFGVGTYTSRFVRAPGNTPSYVYDPSGSGSSWGCLGNTSRPLTLQAY